MSTKRTHFPRTTPDQRRLLFETWEASGSIEESCKTAKVCRQTFYNWKPRFTAGSYSALLDFASPAPKEPHRIEPAIEQRVTLMRQQNPNWGKRRIADEITKNNQWVPLVTPNTVRRILQDAGLWPEQESQEKKDELTFVSRTADQPGQTLNVDSCFVPAEHLPAVKLPAVSGSSGRLVISALPRETAKPSSPGQVFADESLDYTEAMLQFVAASRDADGLAPAASEPPARVDEKSALKAQKRALQQAVDELRVARRQQRTQRRVEDNAWAALKTAPPSAPPLDETVPLSDETAPAPAPPRAVALESKRSLRAQRRAQHKQRQVEDALWRQRRRQLRELLSALPLVTMWIAILVITDNCTRQCLGLALFVTGPKVTAELIVAALKVLLPPELQFLISDRGTHFTANAFRILMRDEEFIHVLIARHRPQSNGIAERFVRTLKEWLATQSWQNDRELEILLAQFIAEYNDRPHQGLAIPGLSPNEFAHRCWLF